MYASTLPERFSAIYRNKVWLNGRQEGSLSGFGSELESTEPLRARLPGLLKSLGTKVLLDVGCGDFNWMRQVQLPCRYIGVDIVRHVIEANQIAFGNEERQFQLLDATSDSLPAADTVLCREVIFHLSFDDAWRLLTRVRESGAPFFIATNDDSLRVNADILSGDFRSLNLRKKPFCFPVPIHSIPDNVSNPNGALMVWKVSAIPAGPA